MNKTMKPVNQKYLIAATWIGVMLLTIYSCKRPSPPAQTSSTVGNTTITIDYSQPSVKGREIWGELLPYGEIWRTGANEATTFEVNNDVKIEGQPLSAGKYALFTIPEEDEWTIIFNKEPDQWGASDYDKEQDALRVKVEPKKAPQTTERLTFNIDDSGTVSMLWENMQVSFDVTPVRNSDQ